jgi:RNA polymerase sigma-70 factor (ECF subfamily)
VPQDQSFHELIRRVRAGDDAAAAEVVQRYGAALRRAVRARLTDPTLRRLLDSMDVCQSVLASFFVRAAAGQYALDTPGQLVRLLASMARHKLLRQAERLHAARRDGRRCQEGGFGTCEPADPGPQPPQLVAGRELLQQFRSRLSEEERRLADQRALGRSWADIAAAVGGNADALRIRLSRAADRVARELGLDEDLGAPGRAGGT